MRRPSLPYPGVNLFGAVGAIGAGLFFGAGIALGAFLHFSFGWLGWGLNWHGGGVFYNHAPYYSRSTSVAHWGNGGGYRGGYGGRGGFNGRPAGGAEEGPKLFIRKAGPIAREVTMLGRKHLRAGQQSHLRRRNRSPG